MKKVQVAVKPEYTVTIESGLFSRIGQELRTLCPKASKVAILTDDTVNALYGHKAQQLLEDAGFSVCRHAIPHGEENKNLQQFAGMLGFLAENQLTRTDLILALGGGVPGDMAGFAASCYLRGIDFVQVPTTLLAMVDSSVGGKTGLDLPQGKNLAGAFYQPRAVYCDPEMLLTLPRETLLDGAAECVKYGVLFSEPLFSLFERGKWEECMEDVIAQCVQLKADVVQQDEKDKGLRQLLNYGHTFGHAIEKCSDFSLTHGKGVAIGMVYAARVSVKLNKTAPDTLSRLVGLLSRMGLPTDAPYPAEALFTASLSDKKRSGGSITPVLPKAIGQCELCTIPIARFGEWIQMAQEQ